MTRVLCREPSLTTVSAIVGSFNDQRSYVMHLAPSSSSSSSSDAIPPYLRCTRPPEALTPTPSSVPPSPASSSPSSPASVPKLRATGAMKSAAAATSINGAITPLAEEMHHPGAVTSEENSLTDSRTDSDASLARVDLRDLGEDSHNFTTNTLRRCKLEVLKPYWGLLIFVGWRVFRHDVITPRSWQLRALNVIYPVLIVLLLLYTYMYEMVACEWKLDIIKDTVIRTSPKPTTVHRHNHTWNCSEIPSADLFPAIVNTNVTSSTKPQPCDHIVTTYLIPNILHFVAYITGLYYFRIQDDEQMYAMMEKVFLQANPLHNGASSQQKLVLKTRLFLVFGALWVLMTVALQALYVWAFNFPTLAIFEEIGPELHWLTMAIELIGRVVFNSVLLAVIINYTTQCEMVKFYVKGLSLRLQEKSTDIKTAFKDVWLLRQSLSLLNGVIAKVTSLALIILAELTVIGISILVLNRYDETKVWIYRGLFPIVWGIMLCFPLFQAARLNSVCLRIKKSALEMRVFGYKNSSLLELDSFLQFVHATRLRAKLFHVPIQPSYLMAVIILGAFIMLLLVQTTNLVPQSDFF